MVSEVRADLRFSPSSALLVEEVDGECLVLDLSRNVYFNMDQIGAFVWGELAAGSSVGSVVEDLRAAYPDQAEAQLWADVWAFVEAVESRGLMVRQSVASASR